jgi:hypothetical protein
MNTDEYEILCSKLRSNSKVMCKLFDWWATDDVHNRDRAGMIYIPILRVVRNSLREEL